MAWTTIEGTPENLDEEVASFASGVTSVDNYDITATRPNQLVALVRYTA